MALTDQGIGLKSGRTLYRKRTCAFCLQIFLALYWEPRALASCWAILLWKGDCFASVVHLFRKDLILIVFLQNDLFFYEACALASSNLPTIELKTAEKLSFTVLPWNFLCNPINICKLTFGKDKLILLNVRLPQASWCGVEGLAFKMCSALKM